MSLFTNLLKISLRDFFQKRKKWLIASSVFLGLLIGIHFIINHYVIGLVTELVKEFVDERSDGFYEVDFQEVSYVINKGRFIMNDFRFGVHPNRKGNLNYDELEQRYIYEANIPRLHIDIIEFWSIFVHRKLRVIGVQVDEPSIRVVNLNKNTEPKKITFEAGNLYEALSDHLNELKINDFSIKDGNFDYETYQGPDYDNFKINGVTFEVNNFHVNEESSNRTDKIFYMDDIFLEVKSQELYLKDSIHKVMFDKFYLSTQNNELGFENFNLTRRENPIADKTNHDHYEINVPDLRLTGIDFVGAYNENSLLIDSFNITKPEISISQRLEKKKNPTQKNNLLEIVMFYHNYLKIDNFLVDEARVDYVDETVERPKAFSVDNISVHVSNIELDSAQSSKYKYGFDFEKIDLMVKDYEVALPDSINTLSFSEFSMSSDPLQIILKDLAFHPSEGFNPRINTDLSLDLPYLSVTGFDIALAINEDSFIIDEVYLQRPVISLIPPIRKKLASKKTQPAGLEGIFSSIQSFSELFSLKKLVIADGAFKYGHATRTPKKFVDLRNFNLSLTDFYVDGSTDSSENVIGKAKLRFSSLNNTAHINDINLDLQKISYSTDHGRLEFDELNLFTDTTVLKNEFHVKLPHLLATGIDPHRFLKENEISLDTLQFDEMAIQANLHASKSNKSEESEPESGDLPSISIGHLIGNDYHLFFSRDDMPVFVAKDVDFKLTGIVIDQSLSENPINQFDYEMFDLISVNNYDIFLTEQDHLLHADNISWTGSDSKFKIENIFLSPYNKPNNRYRITVPAITMSGIDLKRVLKESYYEANEIMIENPIIDLKLAKGKQQKLTSLDLGFIPILLRNRFHGVKTNSFNLQNARINVRQQLEADTMILELKRLDLLVDNFEVDSTTEMDPERFLFANDVRLQADYLANYFESKGEFYGVNHIDISTKTGDIHFNGIYVTTNIENDYSEKGKTKLTMDNLFIRDVNFFELTQNRELKLEEIHLAGAKLHATPAYTPAPNSSAGASELSDSVIFNNVIKNLEGQEIITSNPIWNIDEDKRETPSDSILISGLSRGLKSLLSNEEKITGKKTEKLHYGTYQLDTSLLKNIEIDRFLVTDTEVRIDNKKEIDRGLVVPEIWLLAEGIKYDPVSSEDSSRLFYSDNIVARVENLNYILPDNLNSIHVDEIAFNSADSTLKAVNFAFIPLVSRYDFGPAKGFQSTWLKMENDSVTLHNVDVLTILNEGRFKASALDIHRLDISIFRDKRVPFPEWQRKPLPQTNLRSMDFLFSLDTVRLQDGFINYQEHAEKAYVSGEIFFSDLNATIVNLTNDSLRMLTHPSTRIGANAKIFGAGQITAEFQFDLVNEENIHSYGVAVEPFDLTEFNRILIPTASVRVNSGMNEKIIMSARANEHYSYGEMKFYYEDLKIALLNRDTETPKGIGNVLGSFFANTFIIKSNNPKNLILRKGDIFFERDKKRAIFNYWTKTFLSGVVSSLGAANNKKKIKKMQEENLKKIQEQKSLETKL